MRLKRLLIALTLAILVNMITVAKAAPSGTIDPPVGTIAGNVLQTSGVSSSEQVTIAFKNSASAPLDDIASTIQYLMLAAADLNPLRVTIDTTVLASWTIYLPDGTTVRTSGTFAPPSASLDSNAIYAPYSTSSTVYLYTWAIPQTHPYTGNLGEQFENTLQVLRPGEILKLTITVKCVGLEGDSRFWFFFRATEAAFASGSYPTIITQIQPSDRVNLYYSKLPGPDQTKYWLPLHNSYDPYDSDILTGHNFDQTSWTRGPTTHAFAKSDKLVHQKPVENPGNPFSFHICGTKFDDLNRNGVYDLGIEPGIDLVWITLLGPDQVTKAEIAYSGQFTYPPQEGNPLQTGENNLKGSYCFNMILASSVQPGTSFTFYIKETVPSGRTATTATLIGPITLVTGDPSKEESLNNNFGNRMLIPGIDVQKKLVQGASNIGENVIFEIKITNTGETTLVTIPLKDTYDPTKLSYVSASIPPDQIVPAGTLTWNNLGPLLQSGSKTITLTFKVLEYTGPQGTTDTAVVTDATDEFGSKVSGSGSTSVRIIRHPVGGVLSEVNKLAIMAPYAALGGLAGVAIAVLVVCRRRRT